MRRTVFALLVIVPFGALADFCMIKDELGRHKDDHFLNVRSSPTLKTDLNIVTRVFPGQVIECPKKNGKSSWVTIERIDGKYLSEADKDYKSRMYISALHERYVRRLSKTPKLYWNAQPGSAQPTPLFSFPGMTEKDCESEVLRKVITDGGRTCDTLTNIPVDSKTTFEVKQSQITRFYNKETQMFEEGLFYQVDVVTSSGKVAGKWIQAKYLTNNPVEAKPFQRKYQLPLDPMVPKTYPSAKQWCRDHLGQLFDWGKDDLQKAVKPQREATSQNPPVEVNGDASLVGSCRSQFNNFNKGVAAQWIPQIEKNRHFDCGSQKVCEARQMYAIDSLARTLYGEFRGEVYLGEQYIKGAARVILNRAEYVKKFGSIKFADNAEELQGESIERILPYVVSKDQQFSVWNSNDSNLDDTLCPDRNSVSWKEVLRVAEQVVLERERFKDDTRQVDVYHYTSTINAPWKGYRQVPPPVVMGDSQAIKLKEAACIRFWKSAENENYDPNWSLFRPKELDPSIQPKICQISKTRMTLARNKCSNRFYALFEVARSGS